MEVGQTIAGKVTNISKTHFIVDLPNGYNGLVHVSEISDYYVSNISSMFKEGYEYDFLITSIDNENKRIKLSWKQIVPRFQKDPFEFEIKETKSGFNNLKENTEKEVEND